MDYLQITLIIINSIITIVGLIFVHLRFKKKIGKHSKAI